MSSEAGNNSAKGCGSKDDSGPWYKDGLCFTCTQCGDCCTGFEGYVWVTREDVRRLGEFLGYSEERMMRRYIRQVGRRLSLVEKPNFDCVFWETGKGCTVYEARPPQCRNFPFWKENIRSKSSWEEVITECPGVKKGDGRHYSAEEILSLSKGIGETGQKKSK